MDEDLKAGCSLHTVDKVDAKMDDLRVADAISEIFVLFKRCNKYIDETMPWALAKDPEKQDRLATVLYNLVESITIGGSLLCVLHAGDFREDPRSAERQEERAFRYAYFRSL